jgi:hypothetical protein
MPAIPTPSPNPQNTAAAGTLALIGGRFEADNDALFGALRERCNGRIAILSMASGYPEEVGDGDRRRVPRPGVLRRARTHFFREPRAGGLRRAADRTPARLRQRVLHRRRPVAHRRHPRAERRRNPGTACIRDLYAEGGLVAGSSAGAAIMSGPMILGGTSLHAVSRGIEADADADDYDAFRMGQGLGFFRWGVVDQHFLQRGRIGRLLIAARASGEPRLRRRREQRPDRVWRSR